MSRDTLSDLLRAVRVRGAVFYYVSCSDPWSTEAPPAFEIAEAVMPGCEHVIEYHMIAKGNGWAAVSGQPPVKLAAGDIVMFPQGDPSRPVERTGYRAAAPDRRMGFFHPERPQAHADCL